MITINVLWAAFGTLGFCILFHVPVRSFIPAVMTGAFAWITYEVAHSNGLSETVSIFFGACTVAILAEVLARILKEAATIFIIPGILPLVPGAGIYYTLFYFIQKDQAAVLSYGTQTLMSAGAIAVALMTISIIFRTYFVIKASIKTLPEKLKNR